MPGLKKRRSGIVPGTVLRIMLPALLKAGIETGGETVCDLRGVADIASKKSGQKKGFFLPELNFLGKVFTEIIIQLSS